jgi:hypothetical protein
VSLNVQSDLKKAKLVHRFVCVGDLPPSSGEVDKILRRRERDEEKFEYAESIGVEQQEELIETRHVQLIHGPNIKFDFQPSFNLYQNHDWEGKVRLVLWGLTRRVWR